MEATCGTSALHVMFDVASYLGDCSIQRAPNPIGVAPTPNADLTQRPPEPCSSMRIAHRNRVYVSDTAVRFRFGVVWVWGKFFRNPIRGWMRVHPYLPPGRRRVEVTGFFVDSRLAFNLGLIAGVNPVGVDIY